MPTRRVVLIRLGILLVLLTSSARLGDARGLEKYLAGTPLIAGKVKFIPVMIRDGIESRESPFWPLRNPSEIFNHPVYLRHKTSAVKAGLDFEYQLDRYFVAGTKNRNFFLLFYNFVTASGCPNDYVIQRTSFRKEYFDFSGDLYKVENQYSVDVLALNARKESVAAFEHRREYTLGDAAKRRIVMDLEIGCGQIPEEVEGREWPYDGNEFQYRVQSYSREPGFFHMVHFVFSSTYRFIMEFDQDGRFGVELEGIPENSAVDQALNLSRFFKAPFYVAN